MSKRRQDDNNPSDVFFWKDYESDLALRVCSLAAQGLWMRMLCVAARSQDRGFMLINGDPITVEDVAALGGCDPAIAADLLEELERRGVFSRDRKGRIYCRKMVRAEKQRKTNKKNGSKGGNPSLSSSPGKNRKNSGSDNRNANPPLNPPYSILHTPSSETSSPQTLSKQQQRARGEIDKVDDPPPEPAAAAPGGWHDDLLDRVMAAAGVGGSGHIPTHWMPPAAAIAVARWVTDLSLTPDEIVECVRASRQRHADPPNGPKALDRAMQNLAAAKAAPPLAPSASPSPRYRPRDTTDPAEIMRRAFPEEDF
ncbi:hypothetical protein [Frigidibacter oleivorans]|uniref:hypothetical protein n=1 Tax=Frigidibacter oleivorans TaxID=2487129 RepID=UPI000F8D03FF|nr:hypothetical protein [Frigidibacter oleivorans]